MSSLCLNSACYSFFIAGNDLTIGGTTFTFIPANMQQSFAVGLIITNDLIVEDNETFVVSLSSSDPSIDVSSPQSQVTIIDNDSKFPNYY